MNEETAGKCAPVMAQGGYAESRVENPDDLGPAIQRAVKAMHERQTLAPVDVRCG